MNVPQCVLDWICLPKCLLPTCQKCCGTNLVRKIGHGGMWTLCVCGAGWPDDKPRILSRPDSEGWWWRKWKYVWTMGFVPSIAVNRDWYEPEWVKAEPPQ